MLDTKIDTFLAVAKYENYTNAAQSLNMTQPAVTQHIHKLEDYYGCQLVDSSKRSIRLTEAGLLLYEYLSLQQANEQQFRNLLSKTIQPLRMGASLSIADYYLSKIINNNIFQEKERLRISVENTKNLLQKLHTNELDCACIEGLFNHEMFEAYPLIEVPFIPVVASNHPYANKSITLKQLHEFPLVLREPESGTREILENWLEFKNARCQSFKEIIELGSFTLIKEIVANSTAVTFLYEGVVKNEIANGQLKKLSLKEFNLQHPFYFVFRKGDPKTKHLLAFYSQLNDNFKSLDSL